MMKVSILVPVYGVEKYIEKCAVSLFEQSYEDIEYIFVNDCTPDRSIEVLRGTIARYPHASPVRLWQPRWQCVGQRQAHGSHRGR